MGDLGLSANDGHEETPEQPADEQNEPAEIAPDEGPETTSDEPPTTVNDRQPSAPPEGAATIPCPHCGLPVSPHARRCPHCQQVIAATMPITRPEKPIATQGGAAWEEAASQIADLGAIPWEEEVHPINADTHPLLDESVPLLSEYNEAADDISPPAVAPVGAPPPRPPQRWLALGGAMFFLLALLGLILLFAHQQQRAAELSAEATHEAALIGSGSTTGTGQDQFTPPPSATAATNPTAIGYRSPTPVPTVTNTATPPPEATNTPTPYPTPTPLPVRIDAIDAGSTAAVDYFSNDILFEGGNVAHTSVPINTGVVKIPRQCRYIKPVAMANLAISFRNWCRARYLVRLHFAEFMYKSAGQRVFNVQINGITELSGFDIAQQAGGPDIALEEEFIIPADPNGMITIYFISSRASQAEVNGLELYKVGG